MASSSGSKDESGSIKPPNRNTTRFPTMKDAYTEEGNLLTDNELVPSSLAQEIGPILRVANEIENENPRVAYLCRFHAFKKAHDRDPKSNGRGVRQFKTYLLHKLPKEDDKTKSELKFGRSDPVEIKLFYQSFCIHKMNDDGCPKKTEETAKVYQILTVLQDVMATTVSGKIDEKSQTYIKKVKDNMEQYEHYNILPFYPTTRETPVIMDFPEIKAGISALGNVSNLPHSKTPVIMDIPEIKAAISALGNVSNLPLPKTVSEQVENAPQSFQYDKSINDILEWLASVFGFQRGNVSNQKEHLILLLANVEAREKQPAENSKLHGRTIEHLMSSIFKNYHSWCYYLSHPHNIRFFPDFEAQQLQLIYIGLYLLIWGESSNIRFMPECICYIFDWMAKKLHDIFSGKVHPSGGRWSELARHGEESFLKVVITPMYDILLKESLKNKGGKASNSEWRNYDDLNEYFWFRKCFDLDWPVYNKNVSNEHPQTDQTFRQFSEGKKKSKTNFVEVRTFWHIFRTFDRMWIFFILSFQAMLIVAWSPSGSIGAFFDEDVFRRVLSIFITSAFLNFLKATLDVIFGFYCWSNLKFTQIFRYVLKFAAATVWAVVLPIGYASSVVNPSGIIKFFSSWGRNWKNQSFYTYCVAIYLIPNIISVLLFLLPSLQKKLERSNRRGVVMFMWWAQPKLYIGRGMHEDLFSLLRYTFFWAILLITKLAFSYYVEILPLIGPTKIIMAVKVNNYDWHEFLPSVPHNIGVVIAIWSPIVLVYFMDTQIWYSIYSTIFGVICGAFSHLGEIRTLGMFRSRFQAIPLAFCKRLIASTPTEARANDSNESAELCKLKKFWMVWNELVKSLRAEDLISHRERDLMVVPDSTRNKGIEQWPPFLLASKIPLALDMAKSSKKGDGDQALFKKIKSDGYMHSAVIECYETIVDMLLLLFEDKDEMLIQKIRKEVDDSIEGKRFLESFQMTALPHLHEKLERFLNILSTDYDKPESEKSQIQKSRVINLVQDMMEILTQDVMINWNKILGHVEENNQLRFAEIHVDKMKSIFSREKIVRLHLLLTVKESVVNVPMNLDARRRITFFANSLFMKMPRAPKVQDMLSFSVLTPYVKEDVLYSEVELNEENDDGISILFYLQKIYPDEWTNFQERIKDQIKAMKDELKNEKEKENYEKEQARHWASYRGQTLSRTVRGMMYYREALELQYFLENENAENIEKKSAALADMKFTYVVSCQNYGAQKKSDDIRERMCYYSVRDLLLMYPSLRVAYIDVREKLVGENIDKVYYSVLLKGGDKFDEEIYRIKLPGRPIIGEGKPENQNHAIIFTRGEALQTIDMNQDNYLEEAFKMRNILEEFNQNRHEKRDNYHYEVKTNEDYNKKKPSECRYGKACPTILGLREHIFTGCVSSLAWFMSNQETSFVTIGQRILANPLRVRFHYGHPDIFDRIFHITRGGVSKASKVINLSEDIFSGFNSTLRGGFVTHHEYIQVGKARDLGMNQISQFEAKVANGNGEQTLSRDVFRLGQRFDFYRMLSFYFTTVGFYFSSLVTVITVYVFLYGRLYLVMSGLENAILQDPSIRRTKALEEALATQSVFQIGLLLVLPMAMEIGLEHGFRTALADLIIMLLQMASMFFTFQLGTKAHYFGRAILHGGSKYRATGRGFVVAHARFAENYRMYSRSHFVKGLELLMLLLVYVIYGSSYRSTGLYLFVTISMWFLVVSWLFAPFGFNPSGFEWQKTVDDWVDWKRWMENRGGIGIQQDRSWESWWETEISHLESTSMRGRILEIVLAFRFFIYQYGIVYHLDIAHHVKSFMVYGLSWVVMGIFLIILKIVTTGRRRFGTDFQLMFRMLKGLLFLGTVSVVTVLFVVCGLTVSDLFASILAFAPTGWAIILMGEASKRMMMKIGLWNSVKELARTYEYIMGIIIFMPVVLFSWFPFVSEFQTRLLFNQAFSRGLQISMILAGKKDRTRTPSLPPPPADPPLPPHP